MKSVEKLKKLAFYKKIRINYIIKFKLVDFCKYVCIIINLMYFLVNKKIKTYFKESLKIYKKNISKISQLESRLATFYWQIYFLKCKSTQISI